jgi:methylated-DNA-[protein]-cysteine S-methyltransferase
MGFACDDAGTIGRLWFDYETVGELLAAIHASLGSWDRGPESVEVSERAKGPLVRRFQQFAQGQRDTFEDLALDLAWATRFQRRVIEAARRIPYGGTLSYGQLACKAGFPAAARAVGSVMAKNRFPLIVPCHRVVASGNQLGGFSSRRGVTTKERLLEMEGSLNENGALIG